MKYFDLWSMVANEGENEGGAGTEPEAAPVAPVTPESGGTGAETTPTEAAPAAAAPAEASATESWALQRINSLTARLRQREAEIAAMQRGQAPAATPVPAAAPSDAAGFESAVQTAAQNLAFEQDCRRVAQQGHQTYGPGFSQRIGEIMTRVVDPTDPASLAQYRDFIKVAIATGEASKLIYELGAKPAEMSRILALPMAEMGVEVAKMTVKQAPAAVVSETPAPITPVASRAAPHTPINAADPTRASNLSMEEWMRRRQSDVNEANKARVGARLQ